jgi:hypothetical protein
MNITIEGRHTTHTTLDFLWSFMSVQKIEYHLYLGKTNIINMGIIMGIISTIFTAIEALVIGTVLGFIIAGIIGVIVLGIIKIKDKIKRK